MASVDRERLSDQLVRLVQVFFALVLAQSLFLFRSALLDPFSEKNRIAVLALVGVFYTTVASWVDWHVAMAHRPYDTRQHSERFRVYADVGVSALYAYLLFTVEPLVGNPAGSLTWHLLGYPMVFGLYLVSGFLRRWTHGRSASKVKPLFGGLIAYMVLLSLYVWARRVVSADFLGWLNTVTLAGALGLMWGYRAARRRMVRAEDRPPIRLNIGVDVDGVLADQISDVLPIVKQQFGVSLTYDQITDWRLPIKDTDIAKEIIAAQGDKNYVMKMRPHQGVKRVLRFLKQHHQITVITARGGDAGFTWTAEWLRKHKIPFDEVIASNEARKSEHRTDVLIDDYIGNILEFLMNSRGVAVLVDQPWNRNRNELQKFAAEGRLFIVPNLLRVRIDWPDILERVSDLLTQSPTAV